MKVKGWNPNIHDELIMKASMKRLVKAAEVIKRQARVNLKKQMGTGWGKTKNHRFYINHGAYKTGKYAGQKWTARDSGSLVRSIRVTEKYEQYSHLFGEMRNVRIYAGNYMVWWAKIFEYYKPYMRPALKSTRTKVRDILRNG